MSKLRRMRKKRAAQKKANIRRMAVQSELRETVGLGSRKLMRRMVRDHQDILQNIEYALVSGYRVHSVYEGLEEMREFRSDVTDDIWLDGVRTFLQSVHRHSSLRPGGRSYLDFVSDFIF